MRLTRTHNPRVEAKKAKHRDGRRNAGFTLTEVLVTVVLVGLVSSCMAVAVSFGTTQYTKSLRQSESEMLYNSLENALSNELSYTDGYVLLPSSNAEDDVVNIKSFQGNSFSFEWSSGTICYIAVDSSGNKTIIGEIGDGTNAYGQIGLCGYDDEAKQILVTKRLIGSGSYAHDLVARVKSLTYTKSTQNFTVELAIKQSDTDNDLVDSTFTVKALNDPKQVAN